MKGQSHLTISRDPHDWRFAPTEMTALCGAVVPNPTPVDTFTAEHGKIPDFNPLSTCAHCIAIAQTKSAYTEDDQSGDMTPAAFYIYAIADKREIEKREHKDDTIHELEKTVERIGVESSLPKS